jgi:hypothetical protein
MKIKNELVLFATGLFVALAFFLLLVLVFLPKVAFVYQVF